MDTENANDDKAMSPASAGSRPFPKVSPDRLLEILRMNCESGDILCGDAADEIERLRSQPCPYVTGTVTQHCTLTPFTLTDEEREAVERGAGGFEDGQGPADAGGRRGGRPGRARAGRPPQRKAG